MDNVAFVGLRVASAWPTALPASDLAQGEQPDLEAGVCGEREEQGAMMLRDSASDMKQTCCCKSVATWRSQNVLAPAIDWMRAGRVRDKDRG
jgi:hypothetical protein